MIQHLSPHFLLNKQPRPFPYQGMASRLGKEGLWQLNDLIVVLEFISWQGTKIIRIIKL